MNGILTSYKKAFSRLFVFLLFCLLCVIASVLIVFPVFYLATLHKGIYTLVCSVLILFTLTFFIIKRLVTLYRKSPRRLFLLLLKLLIVVLCFSSFIILTINLYRTLAITSFFAFIIIYIAVVPLISK